MPTGGVGYRRSCLLTLYRTTAPSYSVQQRLHELDLWAVWRLSCHHLSSTVCLRRYRGCRAVGNGAYIVRSTVVDTPVSDQSPPLLPTRGADRLPHDIDTDCVDRSAHVQLPQCVFTDKVDDMLELRRDRHIDVMCLAETWHDTDSVAFRRLRSAGYQVVDRPRPRPPSEMPTMASWQLSVRRSSVVHRSRR